MQQKKYKSILLTLLDITRSTGNLEEYFVNRSENFYLYLFPPSFKEKSAQLLYYQNGKLQWTKEYFWYKGTNKFLKTIAYYLQLMHAAYIHVPRNTIFLTYQPLFCIGSGLLKVLKNMKLVFVVGDYFPVRTDPLTKVYHHVTRYYMKACAYILLPSPMYEEVYQVQQPKGQLREEFKYAIKKTDAPRNPNPKQLGYIGHVRTGQGIEKIFDALAKNDSYKLDMIGHGQMLEHYKALAKEKGIAQRVTFHGFVKEEQDMMKIMESWVAGLAVYDPSPTNLTYYTEPSKVKMYLQYKLPVIMTKITYISQELEVFKAGVTIDYTPEAILQAAEKIGKDYNTYAKGVSKINDKYEFMEYYDSHLQFLHEL